MPASDREPGLDRPISRRDFLDGMRVAIGAGAAGGMASPAEAAPRMANPAALTGLRGAHVGSFEALHQLRDGAFWAKAPRPVATREAYDLVVVGAGISGLAAAHAFRKGRPRATVLVLDNHDDFGGHAKRNEFRTGGVFRIGYGGSQSIDSPAPYSRAALRLLDELGVRIEDYKRHAHGSLYASLGLGRARFFDRETYGEDRLVAQRASGEIDAAFIAAAPISSTARQDLTRLATERFDPFPGETLAAKRGKLARISYRSFLTDVWKLDPGAVSLFQTATHGLYGVGIDAVPAQDAHGLGLPGFQGMDLGTEPGPGQNLDSIRWPEAKTQFFHFPDGNAALARLLVRRLIPRALPGRSVADAATARLDYGQLDQPGAAVRIRLSSPVLRVRQDRAPPNARWVEVTYQQGGRLKSVAARRVILACWHTVIPLICPELPAEQREAMAYGVKVPLVYTNVLVRNWSAWQRLGVARISCPSFWHTSVSLDHPVSMGAYRFPQSPAEPIVLHMAKTPCRPGLPARDQHRAGRHELLATPFAEIERSIRAQLDRLLGPGGFDAARDILAITVNRWPHGYAYQYNSLFDDFWLAGGPTPAERARRQFGRITIANADSGAYSYADAAIDHGLRAAREALTAL